MADPDVNNDSISIASMTELDWAAVRRIYAEGMATGNGTFETTPADWEKWDNAHLRVCRYVARSRGEVLGWVALNPVSSRRVHAGVAEVSIFVGEQARGHKIGSNLLNALIEGSVQEGIWTLQAGIFPENIASIQLHKRHRFRVVGTREKIGYMEGRWRDVLLMERRSQVMSTTLQGCRIE